MIELVWLIVAGILLVCSLGWFGYMHSQDPMDGELIPIAVIVTTFGCILWPAFLVAAILSSPFWIGWLIGKVKAKQCES